MSTSTPLALLTDDDLERIVMQEFSKAESEDFKLILDCDIHEFVTYGQEGGRIRRFQTHS